MNTQMVSVTDVQRNFKYILDKMVSENPTVVLRDSVAEAVLISFEEYKRLANLEKNILKTKILTNIELLSKKNKKISAKEINKDIEYAKKHAPSGN
ncbi:hypothetical protein COS78_02910 [Candidatus Shapirobacteria bacterium CG06_land_8_20_14_3_00_40_12]|uniref:Antitoxin n=2 Tax=Candidatus Shapironibacteriota TaxID=1752721 RepID=A0A2M7TTS7_9BACT|nr:MAG: hypothetical protein COS78_02910 [Candidatus Shapirobacteria bacterium CG06_land_8_20_14_3_00_40_12]PIZ60332.1 MAG: hypothetical protein COY20_01355 [Candidatus Shapirobacteria bacterium CG_4_10_14_0_2_um_filter_40_12]